MDFTNSTFDPNQIDPKILFVITAWSLFWKGLALWKAAENKQKYWYLAMLLFNLLGFLEIAYLTWFVKKDRFWDKIVEKGAWKKSKSSSTKNT